MTPMACSGFVPQSTAYHVEPEEDDFLKQDNALAACVRWFAAGVALWALIGGALFFLGRAVGLF